MPKIFESVNKPVKQINQTKICLKCQEVKDVGEFYSNKDWLDQGGRDIWCKDCVNHCSSRDEIMEYFWENHREWNDKIWTTAKNKALKLAANNLSFQRAKEDRRKSILEKLTVQQIPSVMMLPQCYKYDPHIGKEMTFEEAKAKGEIKHEQDEDDRVYSKDFNGYFTPNELEYLTNYYNSLENDFTLDTENLRDYARKLSKASLQADKAQNDFMSGKCDFNVVKDANTLFDMLSKSANFAACKRKPGDNGGMGSWSELTLKLESSGYPCIRKIEWEPDDVDKTIEEFRYIVESLDLDNM